MRSEDGFRRNWRQQMQVPTSKMEIEVRKELARRGIHPITNKSFCVLSTTPDFTFPTKQIAFYIDGVAVHIKRFDKDEKLRELLAKRHGYRVESYTYKRFSKKMVLKIADAIEEALS